MSQRRRPRTDGWRISPTQETGQDTSADHHRKLTVKEDPAASLQALSSARQQAAIANVFIRAKTAGTGGTVLYVKRDEEEETGANTEKHGSSGLRFKKNGCYTGRLV